MVDIRFIDLDEAAAPGEDYWVPTDSQTDGAKKIKPSNLVNASDIGLGNVDNTSDADKPVSDATQTALDGKATTAQGEKADSAVQPGDLGDLAVKDKAEVADIDATGTPSSTTALFGDGTWKTPAGGGDMLKASYFASVKDLGATGDGSTDDTAAIQAVYAAVSSDGATIYWPAGHYKTSAAIVVKSNTKTIFDCGAIIEPVALGSFTQIEMPTYTWGYSLFINENFTTTDWDENIEYYGVRVSPPTPEFSWYGGTSWNGHLICGRNIRGYKVIGCHSEDMASCAVTLHCDGVVFQDNTAYRSSNAAYDCWEGNRNVEILNNRSYACSNSVNWNAIDTEGSGPFVAENVAIDGNYFQGGRGACIFVTPLETHGGAVSCKRIKITNNTIDQVNDSGNYAHGIVVKGSSSVLVESNFLYQIGSGMFPISVGEDENGSISTDVAIRDNKIINSSVGVAGYIMGFGENILIEGNAAYNSTSSAAAIYVDSPTSIVGANNLLGAAASILNQTSAGVPTTPALEFSADKTLNRWFSRQSVHTEGAISQGVSYAVVATGSNLATAFALTKPYTFISGGAANTGCSLPVNTNIIGQEWLISNHSGSSKIIYAASGDTINGNASTTMSDGLSIRLIAITPTLWLLI